MEASAGRPLAEESKDLHSALRGDLHSHSDWSDGSCTIEEMVAAAIEIGHDYLALTNHSPAARVAHGLSAERLRAQLNVVESINDAAGDSFRLLKSIEVDILDDGSLDQDPQLLDALDIRVASVHSTLRMDPESMTQRMVAAVSLPHTTILGHCTGRRFDGGRETRAPSTFDADAVFHAYREHDTAVEINSKPASWDPPDDVITKAVQLGCLFAINTDAHAPGHLDFQAYGRERAHRLGVPRERIVNSWPLADLLAWADPGR